MRVMLRLYLIGALDMDRVDQIPVLILHVLEADVSEDASIVDEDINAAKGLDSGLNDPVTILNAIVVGDRLSAILLDLVHDDISSLR